MVSLQRKELGLLLVGDLTIFFASLWLTLAIRHVALPSSELLMTHLVPFSVLFCVWIIIFFIAGLYDQHTTLFKRRLPALIVRTQFVNVLLAAAFFFAIPWFGITPKTNLLIYLVVSSALIWFWRVHLSLRFGVRRSRNALIIGEGSEVDELIAEVNANQRYGLRFAHHVRPSEIVRSPQLQEQLIEFVEQEGISVCVADVRDENIEHLLPIIYNILSRRKNFSFLDSTRLYESIFSRIPTSMLNHRWLLDQVETGPRIMYDLAHRTVDIVGALLAGIPAALSFPFVALLIRFDDGGPIFHISERVGAHGIPFRMVKFRTMSIVERERITKSGAWLRRLRIDELPQVWNVLRGDLSLVGPRPEIPQLAAAYEEEIPYYSARHLIKPGLSGWAQINEYDVPRGGRVDVPRTIIKLSYDLYYVKNRSLLLDLHIVLKTIRTVVSRSGT